jgi:hypothetical protein
VNDSTDSVDELDSLSFDELRHRAFHIAEHRLDVRFFWDLLEHLPSSQELSTEDASAGNIGGSIEETIALAREFLAGDVGDPEKELLRARFIDYIRTHS